MTNAFHDELIEIEDEFSDDMVFDFENTLPVSDDNGLKVDIIKQMDHMLDSVTRIGGEVCRLRAEMDGLLDQNFTLIETFNRLKNVLDEKGILDMDDFQLACDVFEDSQTKSPGTYTVKKMTH